MPRTPQGAKPKGSQRWLQVAVNRCPSIVDSAIQNAGIPIDEPIVWASPLDSDDFAEYMDAAFLDRLGVRLDTKAHLGLPKSEWLSRYVKDVYIDTADLSHVAWPP